MNIVLIGMPGSGKSTLGKRVAERLHRRYVDLDDCIERAAGMPIPEIFRAEGEAGVGRRDIRRDLAELVCGGNRPLSTSPEALRKMFELRRSLYEETADVVIDNSTAAGIDSAVAAILSGVK